MGCGEIRTDTDFEFREDMYSLLFVSMVKPIYKKYCEENQDEDKFKKLIKDFNDKDKEPELEDYDNAEIINSIENQEKLLNEDEHINAEPAKYEEIETLNEANSRLIKQSSILGSVLVLYIMQMFLSILVLLEVLKTPPEEGVWEMLPESTLLVTSRFVCGIVLHVFL